MVIARFGGGANVPASSQSTITDNFAVADVNPYTAWALADATNQKPVQIVGGRAFGTSAASASPPPYNDANAYRTGFGDNHEVEGTVYRNPSAAGSPNLEVELLLRWQDLGTPVVRDYGTTAAWGYEINWSHVGSYLILGRFAMNLTALAGQPELTRSASPRTPASGDKIRARIEGQRIRVWTTVGGSEQLDIDYTDNLSGNITTGNPGFGFYCDNGGVITDFGFESVTVSRL